MALYKVLAAAWLAVWLAGCAQGRNPAGGHADAREARSAPVATLGPDDGLPFTAAPDKVPAKPEPPHGGKPPATGNANDGQGNARTAGR
ncbi:hypothetical protein N800_07860 [Lysobacter daejeonensis GH1-9]|uniref:Lipoprotein n=1 Tax=Lysobacter daejeonensis GH1-9 TaxID=1385517 RepID=A0A0A0EW75_9GAMM|nr:hypothetical protein [Lysobacter daejeonensis]KGM53347.1 hypothetical protein N800_07860 [Lysobacter daejeonensis GH1-9]